MHFFGVIGDFLPDYGGGLIASRFSFEAKAVSLAMLVAVFISNLPEAIAGSTGMKASGWSRKKIILL